MQDRNPGNQSRLSQLLDSIETPPDELRLDKNAAWEKLSARRGESSPRKRPWLLWPAAAMLLILAGAAVFFYREKPGEAKTPERMVTGPIKNREIPSAETIRLSPPTVRQNVPAARHAAARRLVKAASPALEPLPVTGWDTVASFVPAVPETTGLAVIVPQPKKKLKQVHINELEPATGTEQELLTRKEKKRFFLYMTTGSATSVETMAGGSDPQIKIKINNN